MRRPTQTQTMAIVRKGSSSFAINRWNSSTVKLLRLLHAFGCSFNRDELHRIPLYRNVTPIHSQRPQVD